MLLNYHEMTMSEPRDSPQRRKQFLIISGVIFLAFVYSVVSAGAITPVNIKEGVFPGGEFVYKFEQRDYSASAALIERIGDDLDFHSRNYSDTLYSLFLDNPGFSSGERMRFASGLLVTGVEGKESKKKLLDEKNKEIRELQQTKSDDTSLENWKRKEYKYVDLPSVDAAVLKFPFTNGFVSALVLMYKIIPAMHSYVKEKGESDAIPVVFTTCDKFEQICTHYAPLLQGSKFSLGLPSSDEWFKSLGAEPLFDWDRFERRWAKYNPFGGERDEL